MQPRLAYIDSLRGFAILGVIIAHTATIVGMDGTAGRLAAIGNAGVQLFFVVSAFTLFLTLDKSYVHDRHPLANFFTRRLLRIVPVYWLGIIIYLAVYGLGSRGWQPGPELWHVPMHLLLINVLHPATPSSVVPGGWSISVEVLFYLTVPLWFALIKSKRSAAVFCVASMILGPALIRLSMPLLGPWASAFGPKLEQQFFYRSLVSQLACFGFGILLYQFLKRPPRWMCRLERNLANLALCGFALAVFLIAAVKPFGFPRAHHLFALAFSMFALALSRIAWRGAVNKVFVHVGRVSFSAYLLHFIVLERLTAWLPRSDMPMALYFALIWILAMAVTLALATAMFRCVELRFQTLAHRIVQRREAATKAASGLAKPLPV